ncbi:MAG TPA: lysylphosphatidylglycerol synthase transmembrane domain-containing protein, partial [Jatrophihabitans sp.]|nr:lysylphosphatidylglycerol synthase transmembrane domain-containing protein [Jatrophihabitans sp.]
DRSPATYPLHGAAEGGPVAMTGTAWARPQLTGTAWARLRLLAGAAILAGLLWRLGTGPVLAGLHRIDRWSLLAAAGLAALGTICSAWRWRLIATSLGVGLTLPAAVAASYRAQFLNSTLPGGVLGDVHRGVRHGRAAGDLAGGLRAVAWDRAAGQLVQGALALLVLFVFTSPVHSAMPLAGVLVLLTGLSMGWLGYRLRRRASRIGRLIRLLGSDVRRCRRAWPAVLLVSVPALASHLTTFLIAARTAGVTSSPARLLPLALLVLLAMALPLNVAGWGPREGAAAWLFGAAGLGADRGLATATVYGVLVLVASLPGALLTARRKGLAGG